MSRLFKTLCLEPSCLTAGASRKHKWQFACMSAARLKHKSWPDRMAQCNYISYHIHIIFMCRSWKKMLAWQPGWTWGSQPHSLHRKLCSNQENFCPCTPCQQKLAALPARKDAVTDSVCWSINTAPLLNFWHLECRGKPRRRVTGKHLVSRGQRQG